MKNLWPASTVEKSNLTQHIFVLGKTLGGMSGTAAKFRPSPAEATGSRRRCGWRRRRTGWSGKVTRSPG
jgi:hypothetical protein